MISLLETLFISPVPEPATSRQPVYLLDTAMNSSLARTALHRRMFANCQCYRHPRCTTHRMRSSTRALNASAISRVSNGALPRANFSSGTESSPGPRSQGAITFPWTYNKSMKHVCRCDASV